MIALQILDIKGFMNHLLITDSFDHFRLVDAAITTFSTFTIDGHIQKNYYSKDELEIMELENESLVSWKHVKPHCLFLIKGKKTPLSLKITFSLSISNLEKLLSQTNLTLPLEQIGGLFINIKYTGASLSCITATSLNYFTLDKALEHAWDKMVQRFLVQKGLDFEILS